MCAGMSLMGEGRGECKYVFEDHLRATECMGAFACGLGGKGESTCARVSV